MTTPESSKNVANQELTQFSQGSAPENSRPHLLLRSGWQTVNIGDIAHTPGVLAMIEKMAPQCRVTLWGKDIKGGVEEMLRRRFPGLEIVQGELAASGEASNAALAAAVASADLLLHGSGPALVARREVKAWRAATGKPWGAYGLTLENPSAELIGLLNEASFIYTRETASLEIVRRAGVSGPAMGFGPDGTFSFDLRNDAAASGFMDRQGLRTGEFICVIPRLRYTPYFKIRNEPPTEEALRRDAISEEYKEEDHAKLRDAIERFIDETGLAAVVVPEMSYEMELGRELIVERMPDRLRDRVVWREDYWLPDEAFSLYAQAALVVSFEMHSPILAVAAGTPAIYLRQPTDTCKGQMWRDIGLDAWIFEIEQTDGAEIGRRMKQVVKDRAEAAATVAQAMDYVRQCQAAACRKIIDEVLSLCRYSRRGPG